MKKKKITHNPNPDKYQIVHTREGDVLRAKRTDPYINDDLKQMSAETCSGAAKQIRNKLQPFIERMGGRINVRLSGRLRSANRQTGSYDYSLLQGFEMQKAYHLDALYTGQYQVSREKQTLCLQVPVSRNCVKAQNNLVTQYYFEAVLLLGDAMQPNSLRVEDEKSPLFDFGKTYKTTLSFCFVLPEETPYLFFLKVGCMEGLEDARHPKHYGMRVVGEG